jgi:hypothetical protein
MLTKSKSVLALSVLGTIVLASATPSAARQVHHRAQTDGIAAPWYGYQAERGPFAFDPTYRNAPRAAARAYGYDSRPATTAPGMSWDPYGLRWDGGN